MKNNRVVHQLVSYAADEVVGYQHVLDVNFAFFKAVFYLGVKLKLVLLVEALEGVTGGPANSKLLLQIKGFVGIHSLLF